MNTYRLAAAAVVALVVGIGPAAAYGPNFVRDTPSLAFGQTQPSAAGANLSIVPQGGHQVQRNLGFKDRCTEALISNDASDVRAFCPRSEWLIDQ